MRAELLKECNCDYFDEGYEKKEDNNSYNDKDRMGRAISDRAITSIFFMLAFLAIGIAFTVLIVQAGGAMNPLLWGLVSAAIGAAMISGITAGDVVGKVKKVPLRAVYAASEFIARKERTPAVLNTMDYFPESKEFENAHKVIKREVAAVAEHMDNIPLAKNTFGGNNVQIGRDVRKDEAGADVGWRVLLVSLGEEISEDAKKFCPELVKLIQKHTDKIMSCAISILPPETSIPQHYGYYKGVVRYMLAVDVPKDREKVFLCANDQKVLWEEGKSIMFDDTYPHKVYNLTKERRIVLYMDIKRPLGGLLDKMNGWIIKTMKKSSIAKDEIKKTEYLVKIPETEEASEEPETAKVV